MTISRKSALQFALIALDPVNFSLCFVTALSASREAIFQTVLTQNLSGIKHANTLTAFAANHEPRRFLPVFIPQSAIAGVVASDRLHEHEIALATLDREGLLPFDERARGS